MKKNLYTMLCAAGLLALTACTAEEPTAGVAGGDGLVTFSLTAPGELASRAFGDGAGVDQLEFAIYDVTDATNAQEVYYKEMEADFKADGNKRKMSLPVELVNGRKYEIVWWAQNKSCNAYTFDKTNKQVAVNYENLSANDDGRDAFYAYTKPFEVKGAMTHDVELTRPFAQVNFGTSDMKTATDALKLAYGDNFANLVAKITVKGGAPDVLDLTDGSTSTSEEANEEDIVFGYAAPKAGEKFPVESEKYDYLAMGYILAGNNGLANLRLSVSNSSETELTAVTVDNAPLRANYRTNIYGALLTSPNDFNLTLTPGFAGDENKEVTPWDGVTKTYPVVNEETKEVIINGATDLAGLAEMFNNGTRSEVYDYDGFTFRLNSDVDLNGKEFPMFAAGATRKSASTEGKAFTGVFDGQGHTIKNLAINYTGSTVESVIGFITVLKGEGAALKNINFENVNIKANAAEQAGIVGMCVEGATVSNVKVLSGSISGDQGVGGIVGRMIKEGSISNCENHANISGVKNNIGGIVGAAYYTAVDKVMYINDCSNYGNIEAGNVCAGGIVGLSAADVTNCYNEGTITAHNNSCGGIMGQQNARGIISNCVNKGDINAAESTSVAFGGIMGWLKYDNINTSYFNYSVITIDKCENHGNVIAAKAQEAAGIVGLVYRDVVITNCLNTASKLISGNMVAGIAVYQNIANSIPEILEKDANCIVIRGCTSTTSLDNMTGTLKSQICYDNTTGSHSTIEDNYYLPAE